MNNNPNCVADGTYGAANVVIKNRDPRGTDYHIMYNNKFEADGYLVAWQYYIGQKNNPCHTYAAVWETVEINQYRLLDETLLLPRETASGGVRYQYITDKVVRVTTDYAPSMFVREPTPEGCTGSVISFNNDGVEVYRDRRGKMTNIHVNNTLNVQATERRGVSLRPFIAGEFMRN